MRPYLSALVGCLLISVAQFMAVTPAAASEGDLLWHDQLNRGIDFGSAVTARGGRVFAGGFSQNEATGDVDFVRAYDAPTGSLLWEHKSAKVQNSEDVLLTVAGHLLFAAVHRTIRAHDIDTGAVVWEHTQSVVPPIKAITARAGLLLVVGGSLVRAYAAATGTLLWDERLDTSDSAFAADIDGGRVFVTGETFRAGTGTTFFLRALNRLSGELLWEDSSPGSSTSGFAVISDGGIVAMAGRRNLQVGSNPLVRAYDARTGDLLWQQEVPSGTVPTSGFFVALAVQGNRLIAGGTRGGFLVQAYDIRSGTPLWQHQSEAEFGIAMAVTASSGTVYAVGPDNNDWLVQAYAARTGELAWEDRFDNAGSIDIARDEVAAQGRLFVVGDVQTPTNFSDFLVRAYDAK